MDLIFRDLNVSIGNAKILKDISGIAQQGSMLAVMGASGKIPHFLVNSSMAVVAKSILIILVILEY